MDAIDSVVAMRNDCYYPVGDSKCSFLSIDGSFYCQSEEVDDNQVRLIECDIEEKWMKVKTRGIDSIEWEEMSLLELERGVVMEMDSDGQKWEGDCLNGHPFGFGSIITFDNVILYNGFIFEGKKVCYGSVSYEDTNTIEYQGGFYQDMRHGYGKWYSKTNELLYEGDWLNDNPIRISKTRIEDNHFKNDMHNNLEEIIIEEDHETDMKNLQLLDYFHLKRIVIGNNSFVDTSEFTVENCNELVEVTIGDWCFVDRSSPNHGVFCICDCIQLREITIGDRTFQFFYGKMDLISINHIV